MPHEILVSDHLENNSSSPFSQLGAQTVQGELLTEMYNPKSEKVGTVWKTQIKKESSDF